MGKKRWWMLAKYINFDIRNSTCCNLWEVLYLCSLVSERLGKGIDEIKAWFHVFRGKLPVLTVVNPGEDWWFAGEKDFKDWSQALLCNQGWVLDRIRFQPTTSKSVPFIQGGWHPPSLLPCRPRNCEWNCMYRSQSKIWLKNLKI